MNDDKLKIVSNHKRTIISLAMLTIVLSAFCTLIGLLSRQEAIFDAVKTSFGGTIDLYQRGLYARDSVSMASQAIAQDMVTLFLGIPLILISLLLLRKKKAKGLFLLTGTAGYFLYTYASYAFLIVFNKLYLVYVLLIVINFYLFILCIMEMNKLDIKTYFPEHFSGKDLRIFLIVTGIMLLFTWLGRIVPALLSGAAPEGLEHYSTLTIQTLDLGFVVPACFVGWYQMRRQTHLGWLLSMILLVKGFTMTAAVSMMTFLMRSNGVKLAFFEIFMFPCLFVICTIVILKTFHLVKE